MYQKMSVWWKNENLIFDGITLDICPGGLFIVTGHLLPLKSIIDILFCLAKGAPCFCQGEVIWVNRGQITHYPPGFGVQFLKIEPDILEQLIVLCSDWEGEERAGLYNW
ncbi:PilZ domain-containing protein [Desulforhabdus amnigena]|uniref:PilZ domain-containing protein n=1 Tax=Desulforhabdus amnigena TaxID=40218 RepID=A0A9W6L8U7_9BACT|nr:PilZ domain-containing protein [Desulforhabdus amnigena]NLJ29118.1 hypothetical protein [Deltaproteobacteria bacterium]GLI36042.1 hypothetical protein DAMNIGENAA_34750 [Desulforhabdus amnigena]